MHDPMTTSMLYLHTMGITDRRASDEVAGGLFARLARFLGRERRQPGRPERKLRMSATSVKPTRS